MATDYCCGCKFVNDYGTSTTSGVGSLVAPSTITLVDPAFIRPVARVERTTNQSIPTNTPTAVSFTIEIFDTDNMWATATPTRLIVNTPGLYLMGACCSWAGNVTGTRELAFRINGTTEIESQDNRPDSLGDLFQSLSYLWFFQPGDYVELMARQEYGFSLDLVANSGLSTVFWMCYVGKKV